MNSFINMKGCSSNNINRNLINNQKTLLHIDSSNFAYVILAS